LKAAYRYNAFHRRGFEKKQECISGSLGADDTMNGKQTGKSSIDYSKELSKYLLMRWTLLVQFSFSSVVKFFLID
jgi:hypothetical protein